MSKPQPAVGSKSECNPNCRCDYSYLRRRGPKFQGESTTKATYKAYQIEKQQHFQAPKHVQRHYQPGSLQTSYKAQYIKPKISDYGNEIGLGCSKQMIDIYHANKSKLPFSSETEYKKSYEAKEIKIEKQQPYEYKHRDIKFEGESSYKQEFPAKKNTDIVVPTSEQNTGRNLYERKPKIKFEGQSSYKSTFQKYEIAAEKHPEFKYQPNNVRFEGSSSYKSDFVRLPESAYRSEMEYCPIHPDRVVIK